MGSSAANYGKPGLKIARNHERRIQETVATPRWRGLRPVKVKDGRRPAPPALQVRFWEGVRPGLGIQEAAARAGCITSWGIGGSGRRAG